MTFSVSNPVPTLRAAALGGALGLVVGVGLYFKGRADGRLQADTHHEVQLARMESQAIAYRATVEAQTTMLQDRLTTFFQDDADERNRLDRSVRVLAQRVSERSSRPAPAPDSGAGPAVAGERDVAGVGTGAQLHREDSEFLVREAARADSIRLALRACIAQYTALSKALAASTAAGRPAPSPTVERP